MTHLLECTVWSSSPQILSQFACCTYPTLRPCVCTVLVWSNEAMCMHSAGMVLCHILPMCVPSSSKLLPLKNTKCIHMHMHTHNFAHHRTLKMYKFKVLWLLIEVLITLTVINACVMRYWLSQCQFKTVG